MSLFTITLVLFFIMDPIGNISPYVKLSSKVSAKRRQWFLFREMGFALLFMLAFFMFGEWFFTILNLSESTVAFSSALIIFLFSLTILFPYGENIRSKIPSHESFLIPFAIPLVAGPALLATIMLYTHMEPSYLKMLYAILISWAFSYVIFLFAPFFHKIFKENGLIALEKLSAMILILLSIQRFLSGIQLFLQNR